MVRVLVMIAVMGFVLSVATLTAAFSIGGPDLIARGGWTFADTHWGRGWDWDDDDWTGDAGGGQASREFAWSGGDRLDIDVPADVRYVQAPGPGSVKVTGSNWAVRHLVVEDGRIHFDRSHHHGRRVRRLEITVQAPGVTAFDISGRTHLEIADYRQDRMKIEISGSGEVEATGQAEVVEVDISGSGEANLRALKSKGADVDISGSGDATISPSEWAKLEISGRGDVTLTTNPPRVETDVSGSGEVHHAVPAESTSPSESPSPSPAPAKPAVKGSRS